MMLFRTIIDGEPASSYSNCVFDLTTDILVVGLGTAGALSAIAAARKGASVIGVDRTAFLGGLGTAACIYDYYYGTQGGIVIPINEECYDKINQKKYASSGGRSFRDESLPSAVKDDTLRKYALEAGCKLLLQTSVIGVFMENDRVVGAQVFDGKKLINIGCRILIDGTDGIVCRMAGCKFSYGRPSDGHTLGFSHIRGFILNSNLVRGGWSVYGMPESASAAEWTYKILDSALTYDGGRQVCEASLMGTREVPTVVTDETYTLEDYAVGKRTGQPLFYGFSKVDNINSDYQNETDTLQDWEIICRMSHYGISVGIAAGTMIPKGVDGLMIVSRAKGLGHDMASCLRMKYDMEKSGESAAYIAVMACRNNCSVRSVKYEEVLPFLLESGCLDYGHDTGICNLNEPYRDPEHGLLWRAIDLPEDIEGIRTVLASHEPGPVMWQLRNHCSDEQRSALIKWMSGDERLLAENSAIVLGMRGDTVAIPMLRSILSEPPVGYYHSVPKIKNVFGWLMDSPFCNYTKAIILLGRFNDSESIPVFEDICKDGGMKAAASMTLEHGCPSRETYAEEFAAFAEAALRGKGRRRE